MDPVEEYLKALQLERERHEIANSGAAAIVHSIRSYGVKPLTPVRGLWRQRLSKLLKGGEEDGKLS